VEQVAATQERVLKLTDYFEEKGAFHEDFFMVLLSFFITLKPRVDWYESL